VQAFGRVRENRRKHLHLWPEENGVDDTAKTATEMYQDAVFLIVKALGLGFSDGALTVKAEVIRYLAERRVKL